MDFWAPLETEDPEIATLVHDEEERTRSNLELIASESYPSLAVLQAVGGVEIPVSAAIGGGLHMRHTFGVVIHSDARVGLDCNLSQGVTIGIGGRGDRRGVPWLGDRVYVGPGAKLFGPISVGTDSAVGANAVVNRDVPRHVVVAGVPARVVSTAGSTGLVVPGEDQPDSSDRIPDNDPILKVA